ncbi:bifunctional cobalt-precorrin-7 (C(5))-methyltransferase/cobalt-precorrin-6B (C(15))-methyltransferase [Rhodovibrio salinarum]|uniref:Bifunctional cobalt-precorrin-7 (C(5))-methyltransferase/cobalt-precorrin-6B (C(15))-methyltransferase n=1 Tax=Rhodovibrio salinarum TaxID=1087 RepID=A0A934QJI6_9PROT|nr:bifunctional cobalt-precorrin-7 (C(5))-methyltransferase/cobalt-precorrin-6B (C(15))-methyltransferase [Rhodovibrio salinarum]MBK1697590.1 bifunctional cobalt-precorrin-7 (C(5))-methyltransferase/cobalt-precorrin-6B (C(15))-methyltransferase [Rhodovibrio salinarum]
MNEHLIEVVGIGEDGWDGLSPAARQLVEGADLLVGGDRHLELVPDTGAERLAWPKPLAEAFETLDRRSAEGTVVVLATGNPLWYGVANMLVRRFGAERVRVRPNASAFDLACARLGWSEADVDTLTLHGRPPALIQTFIQPGARLLVLSAGQETPGQVAEILSRRGFGPSKLAVMEHLGGPRERIVAGTAESWDPGDLADLNVLAVHCRPGADAQVLSTVPGLPDDAYSHDGQLTKREVRAATLAALQPGPEQHLWDVGAGCGSVGIEWMRAARGATAVAVEPKTERVGMIADNALALGVPGLQIVAGRAPEELAGLDAPDAVFVGGGVHSGDILPACWQALKPGGRLVANAVTLAGEAALVAWHGEHGGELTRLQISRAEPIGPHHGWRPLMAVTQLKAVKPWA